MLACLLPPPGDPWQTSQVPPLVKDRIKTLIGCGAVKRVERGPPATYRTPKKVHEYIQQHLSDPREYGSCIHSGVSKVGPDEYTCCNPDCGARFDRSAAREAMRHLAGSSG